MNSTSDGKNVVEFVYRHQELYDSLGDSSMKEDNISSSNVKVKIAIGFAVACATLLIIIFLFLLYKFVRQRRDASGLQSQKLLFRSPSIRESDFSRAPQQRRHRPLMQADSSASEIYMSDARINGTLSPTSDSDDGGFHDVIPRVGKLEFAIMYDTTKECLQVSVIRVRDLVIYEPTTYIEVYLLPDRELKQQTKVQFKTTNPTFQESFEFDISFSELSERTLQFCVYSFDGYSRHIAIGEVFHSFDENLNMEENTTINFEKDIRKDVSLFTDESPIRIGEVLVSLCYLPTSGRLTFVVLKARLSKKELGDVLPNPFVKVSLMVSGRQIKKTKTSVATKTLQPVYNEAFVFDVPVHRLGDVSLVVRVLTVGQEIGDGTGDHHTGKTIAKSIIGPDAKNSIGLHHWNCMMTSPRKPIAQWHPLLQN